MNISNKGFTPIIVLIIFLLTAGLGCYVYFQSQDNPTINMTTTVIDSNIIATATTTTLAATIDWACGDSIFFFIKVTLPFMEQCLIRILVNAGWIEILVLLK